MSDVIIMKETALSLSACVLKGMSDDTITSKVRSKATAGTEHGWRYREGQERVTCADDPEREHVTLGC